MYKCIGSTDRCPIIKIPYLLSIVNKTGEKQFNLNLSKKSCTFIHKYATIHSQKGQNAMSSV